MERQIYIGQLIARHLEGRLDEQSRHELDIWLDRSVANRQLFEQLQSPAFVRGELEKFERFDEKKLYAVVVAASGEPVKTAQAHRVHFLRTAWFRYAAAVILLLGIGGYILWSDRGEIPAKGRNDKEGIVQSKTTSNNKAILTLADGSQIILDDQANGNIAQQGNIQIIKLDGNQLSYNNNNKRTPLLEKEGAVFDPSEAGQKPGVASYNTITTPKGSQYQIILPDGTKVWLNTASSIKFPTTFTAAQREISVTGEAYFEVAKNKKQPFKVKVNNLADIIVIGTSFNVNAYKEEGLIKTTLVSGSVKVTRLEHGVVLAPGQQAVVTGLSPRDDKNGEILVGVANVEQDIAWKNGLFNFNHLSLKEAMNQLARWYDVEIVYQGELPAFDFYGEIYRTLPLKEVVNILSGLEGINLRIEGRKLIISK